MINNNVTKSNYISPVTNTSTLILNENDKCHFTENINVNSKNKLNGEFFWNKKQQGLILSAFFYGYILTQVKNSIFFNNLYNLFIII